MIPDPPSQPSSTTCEPMRRDASERCGSLTTTIIGPHQQDHTSGSQARGVSLGDFRTLHQDLLRRARETGGIASSGEALHEAIERHIFTQHGYEYPALDPASLAELGIHPGGDEGGVCPTTTHFVGERISACKMTRCRPD